MQASRTARNSCCRTDWNWPKGKSIDQGDAKWIIIIRGQLRGHNDTPFGRPTPGRPIGRPRVDHPQGIFCVYLVLIRQGGLVCSVTIHIVPLTMKLTFGDSISIEDDSRGFKPGAFVELDEKFSHH
jgi:hypothetical protein